MPLRTFIERLSRVGAICVAVRLRGELISDSGLIWYPCGCYRGTRRLKLPIPDLGHGQRAKTAISSIFGQLLLLQRPAGRRRRWRLPHVPLSVHSHHSHAESHSITLHLYITLCLPVCEVPSVI